MNTKNNKKYLIKCIILLIIAFICLFQTIIINALEAQPNEQRPNNQHYAFTQSPDLKNKQIENRNKKLSLQLDKLIEQLQTFVTEYDEYDAYLFHNIKELKNETVNNSEFTTLQNILDQDIPRYKTTLTQNAHAEKNTFMTSIANKETLNNDDINTLKAKIKNCFYTFKINRNKVYETIKSKVEPFKNISSIKTKIEDLESDLTSKKDQTQPNNFQPSPTNLCDLNTDINNEIEKLSQIHNKYFIAKINNI